MSKWKREEHPPLPSQSHGEDQPFMSKYEEYQARIGSKEKAYWGLGEFEYDMKYGVMKRSAFGYISG